MACMLSLRTPHLARLLARPEELEAPSGRTSGATEAEWRAPAR